jgi:hypothetical protein
VDVYFDLAMAMKSLSASLALVRVLYMVLHCAKRSASRTAVGAQEQEECRRGAIEGSERFSNFFSNVMHIGQTRSFLSPLVFCVTVLVFGCDVNHG